MSHVSSGDASSSSDVADRLQNASCCRAETRGVRFNSFVEVHVVPFEDRAGFVPVHPSAPPAKPAQICNKGVGVEMFAELLLGFCARVAKRRQEAALRRAQREEEREMLKGIGGKIKEIEKPGVFRTASQILEVAAQDLCSMMRSDCEEILSSILGGCSDPDCGGQCRD